MKKDDELPSQEELSRIGDASRTSRTWKLNGNAKTLGKELRRWDRARQLDRFRRVIVTRH